VQAITSERQGESGRILVYGSGNTILVGSEQRIGSQTMTTFSVQIGDHATVHGDFAVAETIQNSFNKVKGANAPEDLKKALTELASSVADMATRLPPDRAREVARDLEVLTTEALSPTPQKKWWKLSVEGLKEAAKAVGEIATPVLASVAKVVAFFA
jgi:hypothetical protein